MVPYVIMVLEACVVFWIWRFHVSLRSKVTPKFCKMAFIHWQIVVGTPLFSNKFASESERLNATHMPRNVCAIALSSNDLDSSLLRVNWVKCVAFSGWSSSLSIVFNSKKVRLIQLYDLGLRSTYAYLGHKMALILCRIIGIYPQGVHVTQIYKMFFS